MALIVLDGFKRVYVKCAFNMSEKLLNEKIYHSSSSLFKCGQTISPSYSEEVQRRKFVPLSYQITSFLHLERARHAAMKAWQYGTSPVTTIVQ